MFKKILGLAASIAIVAIEVSLFIDSLSLEKWTFNHNPFLTGFNIIVWSLVALCLIASIEMERESKKALEHRKEVQQWWCNKTEDEDERRERRATWYRDEIFRAHMKGHSPAIIKEWEDKLKALYPAQRDQQFARTFTREEKAKNYPDLDDEKDMGF